MYASELHDFDCFNCVYVFVKMDFEHVVGDSDRGCRKRKKNVTSRERKKQIR